MLAGVAPSSIRAPLILALILAFLGLTYATGDATRLMCSYSDYIGAAEAMEAGADQFFGKCSGFGGHFGDDELRQQQAAMYREYARDAREQLEGVREKMAKDPWGDSAGWIAGPAMIVFGLMFAAGATGSTLQTGTAAWSLSNGWGRRRWIDTFLRTVVGMVLFTFLVLLILFFVAQWIWMATMDLSLGFALPGWTTLAPIPGVLFYSMVGFTAGVLAKRELGGIIVGAAFALVDTIAGNLMDLPRVLPSLLHSAAIGATQESDPMSPWVAAPILLALAVLVASGIRWLFVHRMDVPDRPL